MSCSVAFLSQIRGTLPPYNLVRVGGLGLCSSDFNRHGKGEGGFCTTVIGYIPQVSS